MAFRRKNCGIAQSDTESGIGGARDIFFHRCLVCRDITQKIGPSGDQARGFLGQGSRFPFFPCQNCDGVAGAVVIAPFLDAAAVSGDFPGGNRAGDFPVFQSVLEIPVFQMFRAVVESVLIREHFLLSFQHIVAEQAERPAEHLLVTVVESPVADDRKILHLRMVCQQIHLHVQKIFSVHSGKRFQVVVKASQIARAEDDSDIALCVRKGFPETAHACRKHDFLQISPGIRFVRRGIAIRFIEDCAPSAASCVDQSGNRVSQIRVSSRYRIGDPCIDASGQRIIPEDFTEQLEEDAIFFDYRLRPGPAVTRNAIELLRIMGVDPAVVDRARRRAGTYLDTGRWE